MNLMSLLSGKGFVMFNKDLAHEVSVNAAIIFGQLCSSYESFSNKKMLKVIDGKEFFFLTSNTLEKETALSYKQQMKAVSELEKSGYIETTLTGVPAKKHFHITEKIYSKVLSNSSSDKREELNISTIPENNEDYESPSLYKREKLDMPKGNNKIVQKGSTIKKNNKKDK